MKSSIQSRDWAPRTSAWLMARSLVYAITSPAPRPKSTNEESDPKQWDEVVEMQTVSIEQLASLSSVSKRDLGKLMDYGVLTPLDPSQEPLQFAAAGIGVLRRAQSLREDLALDGDEFALALMLLLEIASVEKELRLARALGRVPHASGYLPRPASSGAARS